MSLVHVQRLHLLSGQHLLDLGFALPAKFIDVCGICTKEIPLELCSLRRIMLVSTSANHCTEVNTAHPINFCLRGVLLPLAPCVLLIPLLARHGDAVQNNLLGAISRQMLGLDLKSNLCKGNFLRQNATHG